jgi:uncharacterized membrane protein
MLNRTQILTRIFLPFFFIFLTGSSFISAQALRLYTPYTKITVPPGESIDYSIDVINNGSATGTAEISVTGLPESWSYTLRSGGWNVQEISVLPGEKKTMNLKVEVPFEIDKGSYTFRVVARNYAILPLSVNVSEQGTLKTEFTSEQANMQGHATSNFTFRTKLNNQTGEKQLYSLASNAPRGWNVVFKPNYQQATSVEIEPNQSKDISVEIKPPYNVKSGKYKIPVIASTSATSASLDLEVDITGTYEMELTTPSGLLSAGITSGRQKRIDLVVRNTGSSDLSNVRMSSSKPQGWEVTFDPDTIPKIAAGETAEVLATIKAYEKAIPGDYVVNLTAQTPETNSKAAFRMSVKTSMLWGWLGILIILGAIWVIYYLFRKYGRR